MAFCQNCGQRLNDGSKYCPNCGSRIVQSEQSKREQEYGGKLIKCPNCGEILDSFITNCPTCGYELRRANASDAIKNFELELKRIEAERGDEKEMGFGKVFAKSFGANTASLVDQKLANLIANFSVPNTKEDIFEFMILAASNIDPMAYDSGNSGYGLVARDGKLLVSNAWDSKYNQVYHKAKMMFPTDPRLIEIEHLYENKQKQIRKSKFQNTKPLILGFAMFAAIYLFISLILGAVNRKEDNLDNQLNEVMTEIQEDIANGNYDDALFKANELRFDASLDSKKSKQWDEQREAIIDLINEKREN